MHQLKICIVSSCGGHLTELLCMSAAFSRYEHFYVINDHITLPVEMQDRSYFITHAERNWKVLYNFLEATRILRKERPDVILSTGAGPAVPFAIIGRVFFGTKVIFVETIARVSTPSLTGRIMYWLAHDFYYQWKTLAPHFPKGTYGGPVI